MRTKKSRSIHRLIGKNKRYGRFDQNHSPLGAASNDHGGFAIGNLTNSYYEEVGLSSFRRGLKLDAVQDVVLLQDEIRISGTADMWWFAHTKAAIDLSEDGLTARLTLNEKTLIAKIRNGKGAVFSVMKAEPLPTSPVVPDQAVNDGVRKLVIHIPDCGNLDLAVTFASDVRENEGYSYEFSSLDQWK
ncbi:MAG: hypothetical protein E7618_07450 [Ruminococcaceae bacterium]|nr:hypothetical protein [Oscillospiraceae bacterium]